MEDKIIYEKDIQLRVRYKETDQMGVVHHSNYPVYYEYARTELLREKGFTYKMMEDEGVMMPVREVGMKFLTPARYDDLLTLGCPERAEDEELADYVARVRALGVNTKSEKIDMLDMYQNALATLAVKTQKVESIKAKGNWTWKRPVAVSLTEFADLVENYIADCLTDGYNIKPTKVIREEQAAAREAKKAEKDAAKKGSITQHKMIKSIPKGAYHDGMPLLSIPNPSAL